MLLGSIIVGSLLPLSTTLPSNAAFADTSLTNWAHVNNVYLRYQLSGNAAETVVLLHEFNMTLESWDYVVPELAKSHRVLRYDLRGFGLSQANSGAFTIDDEVADLEQLLESLHIEGKVHVVGCAVGGAIALKFAAEHPELVASVIAISPAAYLQGRTQGIPGMQTSPPAPSGSAPVAQGRASPDANEGAYPSAMRKSDPARYERYKAMEASAGARGQPTMSAIYAVKYAEVLPTIKVPSVVVATSLWIRPVAEYKALADAIPNSRFEVIETGHFAPMASPDLVTALLKKYFK